MKAVDTSEDEAGKEFGAGLSKALCNILRGLAHILGIFGKLSKHFRLGKESIKTLFRRKHGIDIISAGGRPVQLMA